MTFQRDHCRPFGILTIAGPRGKSFYIHGKWQRNWRTDQTPSVESYVFAGSPSPPAKRPPQAPKPRSNGIPDQNRRDRDLSSVQVEQDTIIPKATRLVARQRLLRLRPDPRRKPT